MIVLIAGVLIFLTYLGYILSRLDKFVDNGGFVMDRDLYTEVLIFGESTLAKQAANILTRNGIRVDLLTNLSMLNEDQNFSFLVTVSKSDVDNILMCRLWTRCYSRNQMISICNDPKMEWMFKEQNIPYLLGEGVSPQVIVQAALLGVEKIS